MVKKALALISALTLLSTAILVAPAMADGPEHTFPFAKVKNFLLKETRYVASENHINGYHDDGNGRVTVYCTRVAVGNEIIAQLLYQFLLLQTDSGPRWLYLGNVKSQFID